MDITTAFEAVIGGSNPSGSTKTRFKERQKRSLRFCETEYVSFSRTKPRVGVAETFERRRESYL